MYSPGQPLAGATEVHILVSNHAEHAYCSLPAEGGAWFACRVLLVIFLFFSLCFLMGLMGFYGRK